MKSRWMMSVVLIFATVSGFAKTPEGWLTGKGNLSSVYEKKKCFFIEAQDTTISLSSNFLALTEPDKLYGQKFSITAKTKFIDVNGGAVNFSSLNLKKDDPVYLWAKGNDILKLQAIATIPPLADPLQAAENGDIDSLKRHIANGWNIYSQDPYSGMTALFLASQKGHFNVVQLLVNHGSKVDIPHKKSGTTALWKAAWKPQGQIIFSANIRENCVLTRMVVF